MSSDFSVNFNSNVSSFGSPDGRIHGWVGQSNFRGTMDIVWTSLTTIFVSSYVNLCLNIPSRGESWQGVIIRRLLWLGVSILGPEFVLTVAIGQWASARRSTVEFKNAGFDKWTIRHGFFADMGGIEINPPDFVPFRVTAKQLHYLVTKGYLPYPEISLDDIWDKSKQDTVGKIVSCGQITYLILQCIARAAQGLAITTLELFALAIVVCSIMTSWCWLHKPANVKLPIKIKMMTPIARILTEGGAPAARLYRQTPMDFIDDLCPSWSFNIQTFIQMPLGPFERPVSRFGNDRFPYLEGRENTILFLSTLAYASIHVAAWKWTFPSTLESVLWKSASLILLASTLSFWIFESLAVWYRYYGGERFLYRILNRMNRLEDVEKARQEKAAEPRKLPLKGEFWSILPLAILYAIARAYLLIEAFLGLRNLEQSAFVNVNWSAYFPHVQ